MLRLVKSFPFRIFVLAVLLRLAPVIALRTMGIGLDDMFQYDMLARSLASGNGFRWYAQDDLAMLAPYVDFDLSSVDYDPQLGVPTSFRAPFYPTFLALIYLVTGSGQGRFLAVRLVQTLLGGSLPPLTYLVARTLLSGDPLVAKERVERTAVIAAWVVACYPLLVLYPFGLATENLFFPLLLLGFYYCLRLVDNGSPKHAFLAGVFLAFSALTRSIILPFAGLAVLWVWFSVRKWRLALGMALVMVAMIAPWVVRNSLLHGRLTGIESSMGYNLYVGYHPKSNGSFTFGISLDLLSILDDADRDQAGTQMALEFIRDDPARFFPLAINRLGFFFGLEKRVLMYFYANNFLGYIPTPWLVLVALVMFLPFVWVAASVPLGLALLQMRPKVILACLLLLAYLLPHVFILSEDRFHLALVPLLAILAAHAWTGNWRLITERWQASTGGRVVLTLATLSVAFLLFNWGAELWREADKLALLLGPGGNTLYWPY